MRFLLNSLFAVLLCTQFLHAQPAHGQDPLLGGYVIGNSAEIAFIYAPPSGTTVTRRLWDVDTTTGGLIAGGSFSYPDSTGVGAGRYMDIATGDFNADGKDEVVVAWAGPNNSLYLAVEVPRKSTNGAWDLSDRRIYHGVADAIQSNLRIVTGNFDSDPGAELLLAYQSMSGRIVLSVYDFTSSLEMQRISTNEDVVYNDPVGGYAQFDLATGDFDRDGLDEIMLARAVGPVAKWVSANVRLRVCDYYAPTNTVIPGADTLANLNRSIILNNVWRNDFVLTTGDYDNDGYDEAALIYQEAHAPDITVTKEVDLLLLPIAISRNLNALNFSANSAVMCDSWGPASEVTPVGGGTSVASADVDMDGAFEVIAAGLTHVSLMQATVWPGFVRKASTGFNTRPADESRRLIRVADLDARPSRSTWTPEVVVTDFVSGDWRTGATGNVRVRTLGIVIDTTTVPHQIVSFTPRGESTLDFSNVPWFGLALGDFDGDAIRVHTPRLLTKEKFIQPLVILNVPPTHYDILDGTVYDVCKLYPDNLAFKATYRKENSTSREFSTQQTKDWSVSSNIGGTLKEVLGLKFGSTYGETFSKQADSANTLEISGEVHTSGDDYIFASVSEYEFWEYPLWGGGKALGNVLVTIPRLNKLDWLYSKSPDAFHLEPSHEVGNVLSYPSESGLLGCFDIESMICTDFQGYALSEKAGKTWEVSLSQSLGSQQEWTKSVGVQVGLSLSGWGIELGANGSYSSKDVTTHKSKATRNVKITLEVGEPDARLGMADYKVTPLMYWSTTGALVVDYSTEPTVWQYPDTSMRTWWQRHYLSRSDPAFILPWRYDREKTGDTIAAPALRNLTRSIRISPAIANAGDTVRISARIHNFSLRETPLPVTVRFYVGDPDSGGAPIVGTGGLTQLVTPGAVPARGTNYLTMFWRVTEPGLTPATRIYCVLDPDHAIDEIHEDNNKGWTILTLPSVVGVDDRENRAVPVQAALRQNYPNPFNPRTVIPFELSGRSHVALIVYDILGRKVATLVNEFRDAGRHNVIFDATDVASGVYFYRFQANDVVQTRKLMVLR